MARSRRLGTSLEIDGGIGPGNIRAAVEAGSAAGRDYPQIGMALDLGSLARQHGGRVDLKDPDAQRSLVPEHGGVRLVAAR